MISAIAEVRIVDICISAANIHVVVNVGNVRVVVVTLAVIVTEKLLFAGIRNSGSCSLPRLNSALFIGVSVAFWYITLYVAVVGKMYLRYASPVPFVQVMVNVTNEPEIADCVAGARFILFTSAIVNHTNHKRVMAMIYNAFLVVVL